MKRSHAAAGREEPAGLELSGSPAGREAPAGLEAMRACTVSGIAIAAEAVGVRLGSRQALADVSLTIRYGEITAILGPNGAGKSTLLRALAGLIPRSGTIRYGDEWLDRLTHTECARRVAYVPQRSQLGAALAVDEVVALGRFPHRTASNNSPARDRAAVERALEQAGIEALRSRLYTQLSGGEQRRVLLARALATEAPVILLDEPTDSLDVAHTLKIFSLLHELAASGRAVVTVLHALDDARRHADRALLLDAGAPVASGSARDVVAPYTVRSVYGVDLVEEGALGFSLADDSSRDPVS